MKKIYLIKAILLFLFILQLSSGCMIIEGGAMYRQASREEPYDAIIVPGVPYADSSMSKILNLRVHWAVHLYKTGIAKNIIFSGAAVYTPYVESTIMSLMAQKLGVPASAIIEENKAEHSTENMYYSYQLGKKRGFKRIALASDPVQTFMLSELNEKLKLYDIDFLPMDMKYARTIQKSPIYINPESARKSEFISIKDRQNFSERFKGTKGNYIQLGQE